MKGTYRSRSRLVMDLLGAIQREGPVGVTRLLTATNLTHGRLQEMLEGFEAQGWVATSQREARSQWVLTERGQRALADLRRVDAAMQDHGLEL